MPLRARLIQAICFVGLGAFVATSIAGARKSPAIRKELFQKIDLKILGQNREAHLFDPQPGTSELRPLLIFFHGAGGSSLGTDRLTNLQERAQKKNFLLLYPQGLNKVWNDGGNKKAEGHADLEFFDELLERMKSQYRADPKRVFVAGMSNGGLFSFRLACERSEQIQGMASVAATMGEDLSLKCHPKEALSVLLIMGSEDPIVPFEGGSVASPWRKKSLGKVLSASRTLSWWSKHLKCSELSPPSEQAIEADRKISVEVLEHPSCRSAHRVKGVWIRGGGHTWPGGWQYLPEAVIGKTPHLFSASDELLRFFSL